MREGRKGKRLDATRPIPRGEHVFWSIFVYYDLPAPRRYESAVTDRHKCGRTIVTLRDNLKNGIRSILRIFSTEKKGNGSD